MTERIVYAFAPNAPGWPCRVPGLREMKFRVFDLVNRTMHQSGPITSGVLAHQILFPEESQLRFRLMQWTGLLDKKGNEIYEGDLVEAWSAGSSGVFQVRFRQEALPGFFLYPASFGGSDFWKLHGSNEGGIYYDTGAEVIGNVYTTPERGPKIRGECRWCLCGYKPMMLDDNGVKVEISKAPGKLRHAADDSWWDCEEPEEAKEERWVVIEGI